MAAELRLRTTNRAGYGVAAGIVMALVEVIASVAGGLGPLLPFRMAASVVLGDGALGRTSTGVAFVVGLLVHMVLSAIFGLIYGALNARGSQATRVSWGRESVLGLIYGLAIWLVDFQIIARSAYPWFLGTAQFLQAITHALFYGLPLTLMYVMGERRIEVFRPTHRRVRT